MADVLVAMMTMRLWMGLDDRRKNTSRRMRVTRTWRGSVGLMGPGGEKNSSIAGGTVGSLDE